MPGADQRFKPCWKVDAGRGTTPVDATNTWTCLKGDWDQFAGLDRELAYESMRDNGELEGADTPVYAARVPTPVVESPLSGPAQFNCDGS